MKIFIKRFYGFNPIEWPVVSFSQPGSLHSLLEKSEAGDLMAFVGTKGDQTKTEHQGKLLGLAEFGRKQLTSRQTLPPESFRKAEKGPNGDIKWPYALLITRAWEFTNNPLPNLKDVIGRQLPQSARSHAILLEPYEQQSILALPRREINVAFTRAIFDEREEIAKIVGSGGTMGPIPSSFTTEVTRDCFKEAFTYAYQFGSENAWKVGWAHKAEKRLGELNKHIPYKIIKQKWGNGFTQSWASADQAYAMEQDIFRQFPDADKEREIIYCNKDQIWNAWLKSR